MFPKVNCYITLGPNSSILKSFLVNFKFYVFHGETLTKHFRRVGDSQSSFISSHLIQISSRRGRDLCQPRPNKCSSI